MQRRREFDARVDELVRRALSDGSVTSGLDPSLTTRLIFGLVNSVSEWYQPERGIDEVGIPEAIVALVMHGLTPSPTPPVSSRPIPPASLIPSSTDARTAALTEAR
jgi:hypothetical protein